MRYATTTFLLNIEVTATNKNNTNIIFNLAIIIITTSIMLQLLHVCLQGIYGWKNFFITWLLGSLTCSIVWVVSSKLFIYVLTNYELCLNM